MKTAITIFLLTSILLFGCKKEDKNIENNSGGYIKRVIGDIEGNSYEIKNIGNQTWIIENLKVTKYNDGTNIPNVLDDTSWSNLNTGALCEYENTPSNSMIYGKLYNWSAVKTGKLCPKGSHIPSDTEWTQLIEYLGGDTVAGSKLKQSEIIIPNDVFNNSRNGFKDSLAISTNETDFTALPGGYRDSFGSFTNIGNTGQWWSSTEGSIGKVWGRIMSNESNGVNRISINKEVGVSVRCLMDKFVDF